MVIQKEKSFENSINMLIFKNVFIICVTKFSFNFTKDCLTVNWCTGRCLNLFVQVLLELNGRTASYLYENDWAYFEPFLTPICEFISEMDKFLLIIVKSSPLHFLVSFYNLFFEINFMRCLQHTLQKL